MNGLHFVFLAQKEPVQKSNLLTKPNKLGALRACATIMHGLVNFFFFLPFISVTLSSLWLKSSTGNIVYFYISFCDNSRVTDGDPSRSAPDTLSLNMCFRYFTPKISYLIR